MTKNFTRIILKNNIRIYLSDLTDVASSILRYHKYLPFPNLILANAIAAFSPLIFLYEANNLLIRLKSNGAIKSLILEAKNNSVRALISNPNIETEYDKDKFNTIPLILGLGDSGFLEISREIKNEIFKSETLLAKFDIVTDLAYFLNKSDQIFSAVLNDVELDNNNPNLVKKAKNVIFQLLPNHSEEDKVWIEEFIKNYPLKKYSILELEQKINGEFLAKKELNSNCWCSDQKIKETIKLLSAKDKKDLFQDDQPIEIICEFCKKKHYVFKKEVDN